MPLVVWETVIRARAAQAWRRGAVPATTMEALGWMHRAARAPSLVALAWLPMAATTAPTPTATGAMVCSLSVATEVGRGFAAALAWSRKAVPAPTARVMDRQATSTAT